MISLAETGDFTIGPLRVRPATRQIEQDGVAVTVEPKIMQLLVVLGEQPGRVVSRDELVERCWAGRIVGEDAINRAIAKLRRLGEGPAQQAFRVETVARVGYRLVASPPPEPVTQVAPEAPETAAPKTAAPETAAPAAKGRRILVAAGLAVVLVAGLAAWWQRPPRPNGERPAVQLTDAVTDLKTRGLAAMFENRPEQAAIGITYLRQATERGPRSTAAWGSLAMAYVISLGWAAPAERDAIAARARDAAAHALAIDPHEGRSLAALVSLQPTFGAWTAKDAALADAERRSPPGMAPLIYQRVQFLMAVGRNREALALIGPLARASPLVPWIRAAEIQLLFAAGRIDAAEQAVARAAAIWPRDRLIWFTRFDLAAYGGRRDAALAMAADRAHWPHDSDAAEIRLAADAVQAMAEPSLRTGVLARAARLAATGHGGAERAVRIAAGLGAPEKALAHARTMLAPAPAGARSAVLPPIGLAGEPPTLVLFLPPTADVQRQPGFLPLMEQIGLVDYWRRAGGPDFCAQPALFPRCRALGIPAQAATAA